MPVPHDYYNHDSDIPRLHNRDHARPYVEPDWQAHAAGDQLPLISTIGRGPRGTGLYASNFAVNGKSFGFDICSDATGEPIQHIGPIPTGQVSVSVLGDNAISITTNVLGGDGQVRSDRHVVQLPQGADGSRVYSYANVAEYSEDDVYFIDTADLTYFDSPRAEELPDVRVYDGVVFCSESEEDRFLMFGDVFSIDQQGIAAVAVHMKIPMSDLAGPKGDRGPRGYTGDRGKSAYQVAVDEGFVGSEQQWLASLKGETGDDGFSPTVSVVDTSSGHLVTITDATGAHPFTVEDGHVDIPNLNLVDHVSATIDSTYSDYPDTNRLIITGAMPIPALGAVKYYVTVTNPDEIPLCTVQEMEIHFTDGTVSFIDTHWNTTDDPSFKDFASINYLVFTLDMETDDIIVENLAQYVKITNNVWQTNPPNKHTTGIGLGTIMEFNDTNPDSQMEYYIDNDTIVHYPDDYVFAYSAAAKYNFVIVANPVRGDSNLMMKMILESSGGSPVHFSMNDNTFVVRDIQVFSSRVWIYLEPLTWNALPEEDMTAQE